MSRNLIAITLIVLSTSFSFGQKRVVDSLTKLLDSHSSEDSIRVALLIQLATTEMYNHPSVAGKYALEARIISEKIGYGNGIAQGYRLIGNSFWAQANQAAALDNFLKGMKIADSLHIQQVHADLLGNLGMVYNDMSDFTSALNYYKLSLSRQVELKNKLREAIMRLNVGNGYYRLKKYDSSLIYYRQSMEMLVTLKNTRNIIDLLNLGIGDAYADMGNYDEALPYYFKAKRSSDTTHQNRARIHSRISIAKVHIQKRDYAKADQELLQALSYAKKAHMKTYVRDCYELLSKSAALQKNTDRSFEYFKQYNACKDSIQNNARESRIASLQLEYEMQQKKLEIDGLRKDSQLTAEEIRLKNTMLVTSSIVLLVVGVFLFYIFRGFRMQKSLRLQLEERNIEIIKQREELAKLRDDMFLLNKEVRSQQDEVILQRDILIHKNQSIERLHRQVTETNQNLEAIVALRTAVLQEQNKRMEEYAYINAFKLRGPVANIVGIVNLLKKETQADEEQKMVGYLKKSSDDLDAVIRSISDTLQHGITAYEKQNYDNGAK